MCEVCENITVNASKLNVNAYDPTRTTTLRNRMVAESNRYFESVIKEIRTAVIDGDIFGLEDVRVYQTPGNRAYAFLSDERKVQEFLDWLEDLINRNILEVSDIPIGMSQRNWMYKYLLDAYQRGVSRARTELIRAGYDVPTIAAAGGLQVVMQAPIHLDTVAMLYTRTFNDLKGITAQMQQQVARILSEGIMSGANPRKLARRLVSTINGSGMGDLGITDSLGRFIPAKRRAEILARTEIIRAHHYANVSEYKTWGAYDVKVKAELVTAGDSRVCPICAGLEGNIYSLEEATGLIPVHPQCFIDPQIPIYTSKGWRKIGDIKVGDYVLTHKKRFKKVYALPRMKKQLPKVVTLTLETGKKITMTDEHPVLMQTDKKGLNRWIEAKKVKTGDSLKYFANRCKRCNKLIPYDRKYCSRTCLSKDITDKQWSDEEHRKNVSKKNRKSMLEQYKSGKRDRFETTKKANNKIRQMTKDGTYGWWMDDAFFDKSRKVTNTKEHREASSKRMLLNNPMTEPEIREKAKMSLIKTLEEHPEKRLNARMANHRKSIKMTWIEKRMSLLLDKIGVNYIFQYPILRYDVDFAIPSLRIAIECDGEYWHRDKEKDRKRQERIEKEGWFVLRFTGKRINQCLDEIEKELVRVVGNHTGSYETLGVKVKKVEHWIPNKKKTLYNLSVEDDESYIAKGLVVHNCRCIIMPIVKPMKGGN